MEEVHLIKKGKWSRGRTDRDEIPFYLYSDKTIKSSQGALHLSPH